MQVPDREIADKQAVDGIRYFSDITNDRAETIVCPGPIECLPVSVYSDGSTARDSFDPVSAECRGPGEIFTKNSWSAPVNRLEHQHHLRRRLHAGFVKYVLVDVHGPAPAPALITAMIISAR